MRQHDACLWGRFASPLIPGLVVFGLSLLGSLTRAPGLLAALWPANAVLLGLLVRFPVFNRPASWVMATVGYLMASRQMFLHILPGDTGYGSVFLGLHFYTWALITSVLIIAAVAVILAVGDVKVAQRPLNISPVLFHCASWGRPLLIAANIISTMLECAGGQYADNPVIYELLSK